MATSSATQVLSHLASKSLIPTQTWLNTFLATQRPTTPLPALKQTALFRLLASDITTSLDRGPTNGFPSDILNAQIVERKLAGPIVVQVIDVEDIGRSRWSQIEAIEAIEKGETTKGREVIRTIPGEEGEDTPSTAGGPHKLLLQDCKGARVFGIELISIEGIGLNMSIGTKMILENITVARAVILLEPLAAKILGGKIDNLHKVWKDGRKAALQAAARAGQEA